MRALFMLVIAAVAIIHLTSTAPPEKRPPPPNGKGNKAKGLSKKDKDDLLANCQQQENKCKGQKPEYKESRKQVKNELIAEMKQDGVPEEEIEQKIEERLNKLQQLKIKVLEKMGLSEIEPADDGLVQGDIKLTDEQVDFLISQSENEGQVAKRSAAMYLEQFPQSRWPMAVHYWIDASASELEGTIDAALSTLTQNVPCLQFVKDSAPLTKGQLQYFHSYTGCGGNSYIGMRTDKTNPINLAATASYCTGDVFKGVIMHETIHALGGGHEQSRTDRNDYIEILTANINPQMIFNYDIFSGSTSYGVPYDYKSRMHYQNGAFAITSGLPTMKAIDSDVTTFGGTYLTANDIEQLKRMYCAADTCKDEFQDCGDHAIWGYCGEYVITEGEDYTWVRIQCPKSCGLC